ncbi:ferritin-like domain-containing protein [Paenarthrobacter sp. Z7-10]|uniref:ferritin-like domain-containing protein n=1 Tax=Paenarthrobacter sp. Z7-10 TaxID=2787635 RepID=UPI0022A8E06C|nr:ferritin-like domain-containing protein [Paenarthrobacter sp. Z7-10]MCZ2402821.1 ferritin-like domain-containing protein [Paenarthrobacter sp. Z7-10]
MFEHFNTPEEIFSFKLGSALSMERDSLDMLTQLQSQAQRPELADLLREHADETRQQIANVEQCFQLLGEEVNDSPSPTTKGLAKEGASTIKKTDVSLVDDVVLAGALETEHYEIAVYETLVMNAEARGTKDVASLLRQNLEQEVAAAGKIKDMAQRISREGIAYRKAPHQER